MPDGPAAAAVDATPPANSGKEEIVPENTPPGRDVIQDGFVEYVGHTPWMISMTQEKIQEVQCS